jgi:hypothetical protein
MGKQWFWLLLTAAVLLWYSSVTVYIAYQGMKDIKSMLARLGKKQAEAERKK